jgi:integrase
LKKAVIQKYIRSNPTEYIVLPKRKRPDTHAYSLEEVNILLERSKFDIALQTIIGLGCLAGLRRSEMCALKISNIILSEDKNEIQIKENIVKFDKTVYTREGKTHNSIRNIPIPQTLVDILNRSIKDYRRRKLKYGEAFKDTEGQLLAYEDGSFRDPQGIYKVYHKFIQEQVDLPHYNLHQLRHTYASIMVNLGVNPKIIQENLGHADLTTTLNVYTHTYSKTKHMEAKRLDEALKMAK